MPAEQANDLRNREYTISKLFISDYDKFSEGLRDVFGVGTNHEVPWGFQEHEMEVTIIAFSRGPEDLLKELQDLGYAEKQEMGQMASGSMRQYYKKRSQA
ncbi:uncharacterized protein FTOL_06381 [Fusarium torulosum]|uniref:Uncharacterized protein n=1 Tax=Fusarium torulosum TaxID=33205 RepID=A0AAE8SIS4_9HYPO|nr:uncharacterized protein FTOL_06381 [Fusarium torulosum]